MPFVAINCHKQPKIATSCQKLLKVAIRSHKLPQAAKSCYKLRCILGLKYQVCFLLVSQNFFLVQQKWDIKSNEWEEVGEVEDILRIDTFLNFDIFTKFDIFVKFDFFIKFDFFVNYVVVVKFDIFIKLYVDTIWYFYQK